MWRRQSTGAVKRDAHKRKSGRPLSRRSVSRHPFAVRARCRSLRCAWTIHRVHCDLRDLRERHMARWGTVRKGGALGAIKSGARAEKKMGAGASVRWLERCDPKRQTARGGSAERFIFLGLRRAETRRRGIYGCGAGEGIPNAESVCGKMCLRSLVDVDCIRMQDSAQSASVQLHRGIRRAAQRVRRSRR